jgi:hypothetical protein
MNWFWNFISQFPSITTNCIQWKESHKCWRNLDDKGITYRNCLLLPYEIPCRFDNKLKIWPVNRFLIHYKYLWKLLMFFDDNHNKPNCSNWYCWVKMLFRFFEIDQDLKLLKNNKLEWRTAKDNSVKWIECFFGGLSVIT